MALAAAAAATSQIALGTYVANAGVRDPLQLAADVATLDLVSHGRALLGIGAGHTPAEWTMSGREYPPPDARVTRLIESVEVIEQLLVGETVNYNGDTVVLRDAALATPRPVHGRIPLLIGGNNRRLLEFAGAKADIVGIAGLGRTGADGHTHEVRWRDEQIDASLGAIHRGAQDRLAAPEIDALVQYVEVTPDAGAATARLAARIPGVSADDIRSSPFVLIGTETEIAREVRNHHARWGISRFTVRTDAFDAAARVVELLGH